MHIICELRGEADDIWRLVMDGDNMRLVYQFNKFSGIDWMPIDADVLTVLAQRARNAAVVVHAEAA